MSEPAYHELICKDEPTHAPDCALALSFRHGCTCAVGREEFKTLGGPGSGNFDHVGIPGHQGGSAPGGGSDVEKVGQEARRRAFDAETNPLRPSLMFGDVVAMLDASGKVVSGRIDFGPKDRDRSKENRQPGESKAAFKQRQVIWFKDDVGQFHSATRDQLRMFKGVPKMQDFK